MRKSLDSGILELYPFKARLVAYVYGYSSVKIEFRAHFFFFLLFQKDAAQQMNQQWFTDSLWVVS